MNDIVATFTSAEWIRISFANQCRLLDFARAGKLNLKIGTEQTKVKVQVRIVCCRCKKLLRTAIWLMNSNEAGLVSYGYCEPCQKQDALNLEMAKRRAAVGR